MSDVAVYIVDDDASVRDSLSLLISLKKQRAAVFASAEDFLSVYSRELRGCVLTDLKMPGMSGLDLLRTLRQRGSSLPIVMLTAHGDVSSVRNAFLAGAQDFLEKPVDDAVLHDVLVNALRTDAIPKVDAQHRPGTDELISTLTPRETEVLRLVARGLSHREIGQHLGISPRTIEVYKARMMQKLRCESIGTAIRIGRQLTP